MNSSSSSSFNVTYSGADNVTLATGDVNLNTTGGASCSVSIGGSAPNMTVILSSCTGNGTVGFDLSSEPQMILPETRPLHQQTQTP